jgi:hypothetical protein
MTVSIRGLGLLLLTTSVLLLCGCGAASAGAATVGETTACDKPGSCRPETMTFTAAPGERNDVTVSQLVAGLEVHDAGASIDIAAGSGCTSVDPHTAICPGTGDLHADLGDQDDVLRTVGAGSPTLGVDAGPGDDVVRADGTPGSYTTMAGGTGNDHLYGGSGGSSFALSPGQDELVAAPGGFNWLSGTAGSRWRVDLRSGVATSGPNRSTFGNVTRVGIDGGEIDGTDGADTLTGTRGAIVDGRGGNDLITGDGTLIGGSGDDNLVETGGSRSGRIDGGAGNDRIVVGGGQRTTVHCGPGRDHVFHDLLLHQGTAILDRDCETMDLNVAQTAQVGARPVLGAHRVSVAVTSRFVVAARGTLRIAGLPRTTFRVPAHGRTVVRIPSHHRRPTLTRGRLDVRMTLAGATPVSWLARPQAPASTRR